MELVIILVLVLAVVGWFIWKDHQMDKELNKPIKMAEPVVDTIPQVAAQPVKKVPAKPKKPAAPKKPVKAVAKKPTAKPAAKPQKKPAAK